MVSHMTQTVVSLMKVWFCLTYTPPSSPTQSLLLPFIEKWRIFLLHQDYLTSSHPDLWNNLYFSTAQTLPPQLDCAHVTNCKIRVETFCFSTFPLRPMGIMNEHIRWIKLWKSALVLDTPLMNSLLLQYVWMWQTLRFCYTSNNGRLITN